MLGTALISCYATPMTKRHFCFAFLIILDYTVGMYTLNIKHTARHTHVLISSVSNLTLFLFYDVKCENVKAYLKAICKMFVSFLSQSIVLYMTVLSLAQDKLLCQ